MDGIQLLLTALGLIVMALFASGRFRSPPEEPAPRKPRSVTRWKRYRMDLVALYEGGEGSVVIQDEGEEIALPILEGNADLFPIKFGNNRRAPVLRIDRPRVTMRPLLKLRLDGAQWIKIRLGGDDRFPGLEELEFVGPLTDREYEIRWQDRLVASISWQEDERGSPSKKGLLTIEIVKSGPQLPFLALALAFETTLAVEGDRVETKTVAQS